MHIGYVKCYIDLCAVHPLMMVGCEAVSIRTFDENAMRSMGAYGNFCKGGGSGKPKKGLHDIEKKGPSLGGKKPS